MDLRKLIEHLSAFSPSTGASRKTMLALSVSPEGLEGVLAQRESTGGRVRILAWKQAPWNDGVASQDLSLKRAEIASFMRELKGTETHVAGCYCIDPAWFLVRKIAAPPASDRATRAYLKLHVDRLQSSLGVGDLVWDCVLPPAGHSGSERHALLILCKKVTTKPIEESFVSLGMPVVFATAAWACQARFLRAGGLLPETGECVILDCQSAGATLLKMREGAIADCVWIPASHGAGANALLPFALPLRAPDQGPIILCGPNRAAARAVLGNLDTITEYLPESLPPEIVPSPGVDASTFAHRSTIAGLACEAAIGRRPLLNLAGEKNGATPVAEGGLVPISMKKAIAIVLLAVVLAFVVNILTKSWETSLMTQAAIKSAGINQKTTAEKNNLDILKKIQKEKTPFLDILVNLSTVIPQGIQLSIKIDPKGKVTLTGRAPNYAVAEDLAVKLNQSRYFENAVTEQMAMPSSSPTAAPSQQPQPMAMPQAAMAGAMAQPGGMGGMPQPGGMPGGMGGAPQPGGMGMAGAMGGMPPGAMGGGMPPEVMERIKRMSAGGMPGGMGSSGMGMRQSPGGGGGATPPPPGAVAFVTTCHIKRGVVAEVTK